MLLFLGGSDCIAALTPASDSHVPAHGSSGGAHVQFGRGRESFNVETEGRAHTNRVFP